MYGAFLTARLAELGYPISPGTVYPTLHRMEAEGLLEATDEVVDGHSRKVYTITPAGRDALRHGKGVLAGLAEEVLDQRPVHTSEPQRSTSGDVGAR